MHSGASPATLRAALDRLLDASTRRYGLAILSRLPIASGWEIELSSVMNRALLGIELARMHQPLTVAAVHLESTRALAATTVQQLAEIGAAFEQGVLVGDFNFDPRDGEAAGGWRAETVALFATEAIGPELYVSDHFGVTASFVRESQAVSL